MNIPANWRPWLAVLCAVIVAATGFVVSIDDGNNTITITVQSPAGPTTVTAEPDDVEKAADGLAEHRGRDETPAGMTEEQVAANQDQIQSFAQRDQLPLTQPDAAPEQPGCKSRFVSTKSSRGGVKPRALVMHYTVGPNMSGTRDLEALTTYSSNAANAVSWHFNIDREGNCFYTVREADKAWTQASANPWAISTEIVNRGAGDGPLLSPSGLKKAARIWSDSAGRWDIPIRRGRANKAKCKLIRSGILDHNDLGACGGGHHDITPYDVDTLIAAIRIHRQTNAPLERKIAKWCRSLKIVRAKIRARSSNASQRSRGRELKRLLVSRDAACV